MAEQALINGRTFAWSSISLALGSRIVEGIIEIEYGHKKTFTNNYGRGTKPKDRTEGNEEPQGSITLYYYEVLAILNGLPPGSKLTDLGFFNIPISYLSPDNVLVNDRMVAVQFTEMVISVKQNDPNIPVKLPLIVGDILYNVK